MTETMDYEKLKHELQKIADDWQAREPERTRDYEDFYRALSKFAPQLKKAVKKSIGEE